MRIISGKHRGYKIIVAKDAVEEVRPTKAKVREATFSILSHLLGGSFTDLSVADLCCGSGSFGLEALSRHAGLVYFVDISKTHLEAVKRNLLHFNALEKAKLLNIDVTQLNIRAPKPFDILYLDPPYIFKEFAIVIDRLRANNWIGSNSILIIETMSKSPIPELEAMTLIDERKYGITRLTFWRIR